MKILIIIFFLVLSFIPYSRDSNDSGLMTINRIPSVTKVKDSIFSFLAAGHIYGNTHKSIFPCPSIITNIDKINSSNASFLILLGDNYRCLNSLDVKTFKSSFLNNIKIPVYNAVGNHDLLTNSKNQDYETYKKYFSSKTYYSFIKSSSFFIILDSELSIHHGKTNGSINGRQLLFLKKTLSQCKTPVIKNLFICVHKELNLWNNNFSTEIKPILNQIASKGIKIFILSGDLAKGSSDLYLVQENNSPIKYIHTHLADTKDDKILKFDISKTGIVNIQPISLNGLPVKNIESYNEISNKNQEPFKSISIFEKIKLRFSSRFFYEGIVTILSVTLIIIYIKTKLAK